MLGLKMISDWHRYVLATWVAYHTRRTTEEMGDLDALELETVDDGGGGDGDVGAGDSRQRRQGRHASRRRRRPEKAPFLVYLGEGTLPLVSSAMARCTGTVPVPREPLKAMGELLREMIRGG